MSLVKEKESRREENIFSHNYMQPICLRTRGPTEGKGEWRSQHILNRLIGIQSRRRGKVFLSPVVYVKHVPKSLSASVSLRPIFAVDFQFRSRAFPACVWLDKRQGHIKAALVEIFSRFPFVFPKFVCKHQLALKWRCFVANRMHDAWANRTYTKPHKHHVQL